MSRQNDLIIKILGTTMVIGLIGIVVLEALHINPDAVQVIVSASVGALAAKLTGDAEDDTADEMEVLGRAVNRQMVAQFFREASDQHPGEPKNET
jgi:hypothetical protein